MRYNRIDAKNGDKENESANLMSGYKASCFRCDFYTDKAISYKCDLRNEKQGDVVKNGQNQETVAFDCFI